MSICEQPVIRNKPYDEVLGAAQLTECIKACKSRMGCEGLLKDIKQLYACCTQVVHGCMGAYSDVKRK